MTESSDVTVTSTVTITPPPTPTPTTTRSLDPPAPGALLGFFASVLNDSRCDSNNTFYAINGPLLIVILVLLLCRCLKCKFPCISVETYRHVPQWRSLIVQHSYVSLIVPCHFECFFSHYLLFFLHANILLVLVATFALIFPASTDLQAAYGCVFAALVAQIVRPLFNGLFYRNSIRRLRLQKRIRDPEEAFVSMEDDDARAKQRSASGAASPGSIGSGADSDWATIEEDENLSSQYNETEDEVESEVFEEVPSESTEEGPLPDAPEREPTDELFDASFSFDEDDYHFTKGKSFKMIMTHGRDDIPAASSTSRRLSNHNNNRRSSKAAAGDGWDEDAVVIDIDSDFIAGAFDFEDERDAIGGGNIAHGDWADAPAAKFGDDTTSISIGSFDDYIDDAPADHSSSGGVGKKDGGSGKGGTTASAKSLKRPITTTTSSGGGGAAADAKSLWSMDMGSKASGPLPPPPRELFWDPRRAASEQSYQQYEFDDVAKYSPAGTPSIGGASSAFGGMAMVRRGTWVADSAAVGVDDAPDDALVNLSLSSMSIGSVLSDLSSSYESGADEFEQALRVKYSVRTHYLLATIVTVFAGAGAIVAAYYLRHRIDDEVPTCGQYDISVPMVFIIDFVLGQTCFLGLVYLNRYLQHDESLRYSRMFSELHPINDEVRIMSVEKGRFYVRKLKESHKHKKELERMRREGVVDRVDRLLDAKHNHQAAPDHVRSFAEDGELTQQLRIGGPASSPKSQQQQQGRQAAVPKKKNTAAASSPSPAKKSQQEVARRGREMSSSTSTNSSGSDFDPDAANATKWNPDDDDFNFLASTQRFSTELER